MSLSLESQLSSPAQFGLRGWLSQWPGAIPAAMLVVGLALLVIPPIGYVISQALSDNAAGYANLTEMPRLGRTLQNTVLLGLGSVVIALVLGVGLARCAVRLPPRLYWMTAVPLLPLILPAMATIVGWAFLMAPRVGFLNVLLRELPFFSHLTRGPIDIYTVPAIVVLTGILLTTYAYLFVYLGLIAMGQDVADSARICGASERRTFWLITLPLLRPQLVYAAAVVLLLALGQFTAPLLLGSPNNINVLTTEMFWLMQRLPVRFGDAAALGSFLVAMGIMLALVQRRLVGDTTRFVSRSGASLRTNARTSLWAAVPIAVYGIMTVVAPLAALVRLALSPFWSGQLTSPITFRHVYFVLFENPTTIAAIQTSVIASCVAVAIVLPIGLATAYVTQSKQVPKFLKDANELLVLIPIGVPAAIFGAGFLFAFNYGPFRLSGTTAGLIVVYVTITIPFASRVMLAALNTLSKDYTEAARVSGAGFGETLRRILLPLLRPGLAAAAALVLVLLSHEFAASLFIRSPTTQVMSTILYDGWANGSYPQVAVMAVTMFVVTAAGLMFALVALRPPTLKKK